MAYVGTSAVAAPSRAASNPAGSAPRARFPSFGERLSGLPCRAHGKQRRREFASQARGWVVCASAADAPRSRWPQGRKVNIAAKNLRDLLAEPGIIQTPCAHDALSAALIERAGFSAGFMSGFCVSAARLAMPDAGLMSYGEMEDVGRHICEAVSPGFPFIGARHDQPDPDGRRAACPRLSPTNNPLPSARTTTSDRPASFSPLTDESPPHLASRARRCG